VILFTSACGSAVPSEDSALAATENPAPDQAAAMSRHLAEPSGTAALTAGTSHYHVEFRSWIPQYWLVDPATGGLPIPYTASLVIPNFSNCYDPGFWLRPITTVYSRFVGDNHVVGYDGSYRTSTAVDFDWNGSSISNYMTNYYVGTSHRVIDYSWPGGWWWLGGSTECTEARTGNLYELPSSASGANFTFATMGSDSFLPPGYGLGDPLFGRLWGAFSCGNLTLIWDTGQFPSFGFQVQATGQPTYTKTVNDVWGLGSDISSPLFVPIIGAKSTAGLYSATTRA
jgi:hypothetical protein